MSSTQHSSSSQLDIPRARSPLIPDFTSARPSTAAEDYLKIIYGHTEWQTEPITSSQLASRLGLAPSTVTEMVKKLGEQGLVEHAPYASIMLTPAGRTAALRMVRRHRLIETWLVEEFGYSWDEVHDEAEILEHALSDRLLDAIDVQLGRPGRDPHGDPIPSADGALPVAEGLLLADCAPGLRGRIVRISDRDPAVLRRLADDGIGVDAVVVAGDLPGDAEAVIWVAVTAER